MKLKSLLFGSAAIIAVGSGAQAADLPTAEPVEYVRICDAFGAGFYYIPGTDTCLKIGGRVRVEAHYADFDSDNVDFDDAAFNNFTTRARAVVKMDSRTQTDFGLIRAYLEYQFTVGPDNFADNYDSTGTNLNHAYIQISNDAGTFTAGHTSSFFDYWGSNTWGTRVGIDDNTGEQTLFAYTFGGGNGFSATLSFEDAASGGRRREPGAPFGGGGALAFGEYAGQELPDVVANVRIDQGWGSAQVMGVLHQVHGYTGGIAGLANDDTELGWAVGAGATVKFGTIGISTQVAYTEGALGYVTNDWGSVGDYNSAVGTGMELTTAFIVRGGISAGLGTTVTANLDGSYTSVESGLAGGVEYDAWALAGNVVWQPVSGLIMGPEVAYRTVDYDATPADYDAWSVMFRVQRQFGW
jgi:hypothetical protein